MKDIEEFNISDSFQSMLPLLKNIAEDFVIEIKKCARTSGDIEIEQLISENSINNFRIVLNAILINLENIKGKSDIEIVLMSDDEREILSKIFLVWVSAGSLLESILLMFLGAYLNDYQNNPWGKWEEFEFEESKNKLLNALNELKDQQIISQEQKNSLKEAVKSSLKIKVEGKHLKQLMLKDLILYYEKNIFTNEPQLIEKMRLIQERRNFIHCFDGNKNIGNWDELFLSIKFLGVLMTELYYGLPDLSDFDDDGNYMYY